MFRPPRAPEHGGMTTTTMKRSLSTALAAAAITGAAAAPSAYAIPADAWPQPATRVHVETPSSPPATTSRDGSAVLDVPSAAIGAAGTGVLFLVVAAGLGTWR